MAALVSMASIVTAVHAVPVTRVPTVSIKSTNVTQVRVVMAPHVTILARTILAIAHTVTQARIVMQKSSGAVNNRVKMEQLVDR